MPPQPFSLEEAARGSDVWELEHPMPVCVWFKLPDRLIRRDDAVARSMTRDAVWVEAGRGETKLAAWAIPVLGPYGVISGRFSWGSVSC